MQIKKFTALLISALTISATAQNGSCLGFSTSTTTEAKEKYLSDIIKIINLGGIATDESGDPLEEEVKNKLKNRYQELDIEGIRIHTFTGPVGVKMMRVYHDGYIGNVTLTYTPEYEYSRKDLKDDFKEQLKAAHPECTKYSIKWITSKYGTGTLITDLGEMQTSNPSAYPSKEDVKKYLKAKHPEVNRDNIDIRISRILKEIIIFPLNYNYYTGSATLTYRIKTLKDIITIKELDEIQTFQQGGILKQRDVSEYLKAKYPELNMKKINILIVNQGYKNKCSYKITVFRIDNHGDSISLTYNPLIQAYKMLGLIKKGPSVEEIKRAYKKLMLKFHPDKNNSREAVERTQQINKVYDFIKARHGF